MDFETEQEILIEAVETGLEAEKFIASRVGQYLINKIDDETESALQALVKADCTDAKAIQLLQNKVSMGTAIKDWLLQAVDEGIQADEALRNYD
jgi:hypothetical protein